MLLRPWVLLAQQNSVRGLTPCDVLHASRPGVRVAVFIFFSLSNFCAGPSRCVTADKSEVTGAIAQQIPPKLLFPTWHGLTESLGPPKCLEKVQENVGLALLLVRTTLKSTTQLAKLYRALVKVFATDGTVHA